VNWIGRDVSRNWYGLSVSADGLYQTAVEQNGRIYTSSTGLISVFINYNTFNLDTGSTFFLTSVAPNANYSINFTISILNPSRSYLITVINNTSSAAMYYCNAVSINGISVPSQRLLYTVKPANIVLTGAVKTNQEFVLFYNSTISAWFVNTNLKIFKVA